MRRQAAVLTAGTAAGKLLLQVFIVVAARSLGAADFGVLALGMAVAQVATDIGLRINGNFVLRAASIRFPQEDIPRVVAHAFWGSARRLLLVTVATVGLLVGLMAVGLVASRHEILWIFLLLTPVLALHRLLAAAYFTTGRMAQRVVLIDLLPNITLIVLGAVAVVVLPTLHTMAVAYALGVTIAPVIVAWRMLRMLGRPSATSWDATSILPPQLYGPEGARFVNRTYLMSNSNNLVRWGDTLLASLLLEPAQVGIYLAAAQLPAIVDLWTVKVASIAATDAARSFDRGDAAGLSSIYRRSAAAGFAVGVPALLVLGFSGKDLLVNIFGPAFAPGAPVLTVLGLAALARAATASASPLLVTCGRVDLEFRNALLAAMATTVGGVVGALWWGLPGFAVGRLLGDVVLQGVRLSQLRRFLPEFELGLVALRRTALAGLASASVCAASLQFLPGDITGGSSPALLMGAAAYAVVFRVCPDPTVAVR